MRVLIKTAYVVAVVIECLILYQVAIVPLIPIFHTVITDGVSLQVAIGSVQVNGMHITSIATLVKRTSIAVIIWSACVAITSAIYRFVNRILL